ncbi:serine hydrolase [candidate division KSB1 bacterium]|nr:serine hydrolase [candidate division KSB1 bacterium]
MRKYIFPIIFFILIIVIYCSDEKNTSIHNTVISKPTQTDDGWEVGNLSSSGIDSTKLQILVNKICEDSYQNIHSVLIVKDGKLVLEHYFPGYTFNYEAKDFKGEYTQFNSTTIHNMASVTKSITSILFGIALDQGFIDNVDETLFNFFPQYASLNNSLKSQITLQHLLTMTSGLQWNEQDIFYGETVNDIIQLFLVPDPIRYILSKQIIHQPGSNFYYNGGNTNLLGEIIQKTSGIRLDEFAQKYLFDPLGIKQHKWIYINPDVVYASGDLKLRPRDMAKIGYLMLNNGVWQSKQIVSPEWIAKSTSPYVRFNTDEGYGYQWWTRTYKLGNVSYPSFAASGWGGQNIIILPELNAVVLLTGGNYAAPAPNNEIMYRYILPSFDVNFNYNFEKIKSEAPIAETFQIITPSDALNSSITKLSGHWFGRGDFSIADQLVIENIDSTEASVLYSWGDHPAGFFKRGWIKTTAAVDSTFKLKFSFDSASLTFELDKYEDVLVGHYKKGDALSTLIMNRLENKTNIYDRKR